MRLTIKNKLIGLSLVAILLLAVVGVIAHRALDATFETIKQMQVTALALRNHLEGDMMHDALRADVLASFLARTDDDRTAVRDDVREHAAKFRGLLAENLASPLGEATLGALRQAEPVLENYITSAESIVALAFTDQAAAQGRRAAFDDAFGALEGAMEELSDQIETGATAAVAQAESTIAREQTAILALGLGAVAALAALACWSIRSVTRPLNHCVKVFSQVAAGDLTRRVASTSGDELGDMSRSFDGLVQNMHEIVSQINRMSQEVAAAATQIAASAEEMAAGMDGQSRQVTQVSASVQEMTESIADVARKTSEMATTAEESGRVAGEGGQVVRQTIDGMSAINEAVSQGAAAVTELGLRSEQIGRIIEVIDDIADQTNLLALNAAIEAARAGEHGRGFAVVADEVRKLAERTTMATKEVTDSVRAIQTQTEAAVDRMTTGSDRVTVGVTLARQAGDSLSLIVDRAGQVASMVQAIASAAATQSVTSGQIAEAIDTVNEVARETSQATGQAASAASELSRKAEELQSLVGRFKLAQTPAVAEAGQGRATGGKGHGTVSRDGRRAA